MFLILPNCSAGTSKSEQRGMRRFAALSNKKSKSTMAAANKSPGGKRDYDYLFKLVLIGDSGVGKSCLLLRFAVSSQKFWHRRIGALAHRRTHVGSSGSGSCLAPLAMTAGEGRFC